MPRRCLCPSTLFALLAALAGCNRIAFVIAETAPDSHQALAQVVGITDLKSLQPSRNDGETIADLIEAAFLDKFPIGTSIDQVIAALPSPEGTWTWELSGRDLEIQSGIPAQAFSFTCSGAIVVRARFLDDALASLDVESQVGCF